MYYEEEDFIEFRIRRYQVAIFVLVETSIKSELGNFSNFMKLDLDC